MGATGWKYFVAYEPDHEQALQALRQQVFRERRYGQSQIMAELPADAPEELRNVLALLQEAEKERYGGDPGFDTIEELLEAAAEEGTHSILDIEHVSPQPGFGLAWSAPAEAVQRIFGTAKPTRTDIEKAEHWALSNLFYPERWQAVYVVVYADGHPSELYFEGVSGD